MRLRNRSLVIMAGRATGQVATLALTILLVRIVSQETFGSYRQVILVYTTLQSLVSLQLDKSLFYFVPRSDASTHRNWLAQTAVLASGLAVAVGALMYLGAGAIASFFDNPGLEGPIRLFSLFPIGDGLSLIAPAFFISCGQAIRGTMWEVARALTRAGIVFSGFWLGGSLDDVLRWLVYGTLVLAGAGLLDVLGRDLFRSIRWDRERLRAQIGYSAPLWLTSVVGILNVQFDKLLVSATFDAATYAIYFCGAMDLPVVMLVSSSITTAVMPQIVTFAEEGRRLEALRLWQEATRKISLAVLPCFALFMAIAPEFIVLLYGQDYSRATGPFMVYLCVLPVRVAIYGTLLRAVGQTRTLAIGAMVALGVNIPLSVALVRLGAGSELSFVGPSIGTVLATFASAAYLLLKVSKAVETPISRVMRWRELVLLMSACLGAGAAAALVPLPETGLVIELALRVLVFSIASLVLVGGLLQPDEWALLRMPLDFIRGRRGR